jgi:uncharacterized protein (DUF1015 family)
VDFNKGVHLALTRIITRRGLCETIYSDNATNIIGVKNEMEDVQRLWSNRNHQDNVIFDDDDLRYLIEILDQSNYILKKWPRFYPKFRPYYGWMDFGWWR